MATNTVDDSIDIECTCNRASGLLALAKWVEGARRVLTGVRAAATNDEALARVLHEDHIPYNHSWEDEASEGLMYLMAEVQRHMDHLVTSQAQISSAATMEASHG